MFFIYQFLLSIIIILSPLIVILRILKNKEDKIRFKEKFCFFSKKRGHGKLVWFHGASVGEYSKRKENIEINLINQEIVFGNKRIKFNVDSFKKKCLLEGLDDIDLSLEKEEKISFFENQIKKNKPWIN